MEVQNYDTLQGAAIGTGHQHGFEACTVKGRFGNTVSSAIACVH
jgi:hypothetical protein